MKLKQLSVLCLLFSLTSCGAYFKGNAKSSSSTTTPPAQSGGNATLDYQDDSVNLGSVTEGTDSNGEAVLLFSIPTSGPQPVGAYNGGGQGSKAILGINNLNDLPLSQFESVQYTSQSSSLLPAVSVLYINMVVDLHCDGTKIKILAADPEFTTTPLATYIDGFATYRVERSDAEFLSPGGIYYTEGCDLNGDDDCNDAGESPAVTVVEPINPGVGPYRSIDDLLAYYPNACIKSTMTGDGGMPAGVTTAGFMFAVGSSSSMTQADAALKDIYFNDVLYEF